MLRNMQTPTKIFNLEIKRNSRINKNSHKKLKIYNLWCQRILVFVLFKTRISIAF